MKLKNLMLFGLLLCGCIRPRPVRGVEYWGAHPIQSKSYITQPSPTYHLPYGMPVGAVYHPTYMPR